MRSIKLKVKYLITIFIENILKVLWIFPLKRKQVLFLSFDGKQVADNPLYLCRYIKEKDPSVKTIWALYDDKQSVQCDLIIPRKSIKFFFYFCTSKTIITNNHLSSFLPLRKKQIVLNTWHGGGCYKKTGVAIGYHSRWYNRYLRKK